MTCLSPSLLLSFPKGLGQSESTVSILPSQRCLGVIHGVIWLESLSNIGSHTSSCRLWRIATSPNFQHSPISLSSYCGRVNGQRAAEDAVIHGA